MNWPEEDWLQLSGLQHFAFCRRQWALIHIESQWAENYRTVDGSLMHEHVHNQSFRESRGDLLIIRGLAIHSARLGVSGPHGGLRPAADRSCLLHTPRQISGPCMRRERRKCPSAPGAVPRSR